MGAMKNVASSPHCATLFELIDATSDSMTLFPTLMKVGK